MFCRTCGKENVDNAVWCLTCGNVLRQTAEKIPNHLVGAILVTLFCCQIFGIVSIVYAAQVNGKLAAGDVPGAIASSNKAKAWMWWGIGLGLAANIILGLAALAQGGG